MNRQTDRLTGNDIQLSPHGSLSADELALLELLTEHAINDLRDLHLLKVTHEII